MLNKILIYSPHNSGRLQYILHLIFMDILGLDVYFTQSRQVFVSSSLPKIHYGQEILNEGEVFIKNTGILFENNIIKRDLEKVFHEFDIFSKIFILVTRYEEYTAPPSVFDHHNRFTAKASFATKLDLLKQPVVNQWVMELYKTIFKKYPNLKTSTPQYQVQLTYDIDQAWAFKHKGSLRNIGAILKDSLRFNFKSVFNRIGVLTGMNDDPEYTFEYIEKLNKKYENKVLKPLFFWLLGDYGEHDKNIAWDNLNLQRLIRRLAKKYDVGIHPSYASNDDKAILKEEKSRLQKILSHTEGVTRSRQHYLKLNFPTTYRRLIESGITDDYSMGYSDDIGFRAGIATPFYWYDLENEQMTTLRIHPFQVMEVTLNEYLNLSPDEAIEAVKPIIESIKEVGGTFTTLWHNSTLIDDDSEIEDSRHYKGWRKVYEKVLELAVPK